MKWVVESSPAAVTQRSGKTATLRLSGDCHSTERSRMEEVATGLPADRPLPDDGLFIDQSEMIYSMDSRSFYRESFSNFILLTMTLVVTIRPIDWMIRTGNVRITGPAY
ncbi:unnamed protein product [Spirodela intermedia]|uniref:Uncharacterized protein n=1 Tax=Spirodela intermedia TaxID=51605 RepID=A0A7I8LME9_SPIIN|nr:unnamed protein product [Spirodela intermedia]